jgi:hypothetical protein
MKLLSVLENVEEAQAQEGGDSLMLTKDQLDGLRVKAVYNLS